MSEIRIVVAYDGEWDDSGISSVYIGGKAKGIFVSKKITYNELLDRIYSLLLLSRDEAAIKMKFVYNSHVSVQPLEISDDDDVRFFIGENSDSKTRAPLCISVHRGTQGHQDSVVEPVQEDDGHPTFCPADGSSQSMNFVPEAQDAELGQHAMLENDQNPGDNFGSETEFGHAPTSDQATHNDIDHGFTPDSGNTMNIGPSNAFRSKDQHVVSFTREMLSMGLADQQEHEDLNVGQVFTNKKDLYRTLALISLKKNFQFKVKKSKKDILVIACQDKNCKWRVRAARVQDTMQFKIRKYQNGHSCSLDCDRQRDNPRGSGLIITQYLKSKCESSPGGVYKPKDIIEDVQREFGINLCYSQAWRCKRSVINSMEGSLSSTRKCGSCGLPGHTRRKCKKIVPVQSSE